MAFARSSNSRPMPPASTVASCRYQARPSTPTTVRLPPKHPKRSSRETSAPARAAAIAAARPLGPPPTTSTGTRCTTSTARAGSQIVIVASSVTRTSVAGVGRFPVICCDAGSAGGGWNPAGRTTGPPTAAAGRSHVCDLASTSLTALATVPGAIDGYECGGVGDLAEPGPPEGGRQPRPRPIVKCLSRVPQTRRTGPSNLPSQWPRRADEHQLAVTGDRQPADQLTARHHARPQRGRPGQASIAKARTAGVPSGDWRSGRAARTGPPDRAGRARGWPSWSWWCGPGASAAGVALGAGPRAGDGSLPSGREIARP